MRTPFGINFSGLLHLLLKEEERRNKINSNVQILSGKGMFFVVWGGVFVFFFLFVCVFCFVGGFKRKKKKKSHLRPLFWTSVPLVPGRSAALARAERSRGSAPQRREPALWRCSTNVPLVDPDSGDECLVALCLAAVTTPARPEARGQRGSLPPPRSQAGQGDPFLPRKDPSRACLLGGRAGTARGGHRPDPALRPRTAASSPWPAALEGECGLRVRRPRGEEAAGPRWGRVSSCGTASARAGAGPQAARQWLIPGTFGRAAQFEGLQAPVGSGVWTRLVASQKLGKKKKKKG